MVRAECSAVVVLEDVIRRPVTDSSRAWSRRCRGDTGLRRCARVTRTIHPVVIRREASASGTRDERLAPRGPAPGGADRRVAGTLGSGGSIITMPVLVYIAAFLHTAGRHVARHRRDEARSAAFCRRATADSTGGLAAVFAATGRDCAYIGAKSHSLS